MAAGTFGASLLTATVLAAGDSNLPSAADTPLPLTSRTLRNPAAYIPPQCYTKTQDEAGRAHNPCYTCHTVPRRPNYTYDADLQLAYDFPEDLAVNHWTNLFADRSAAIRDTSDAEILEYVRTSNYFNASGGISLYDVLADPPQEWDYDGNGRWDGFRPDVYFNFDAQGFDHDPQGNATGWRAFAYHPVPGAFWPANGSTDDVLIRLPQAFRTGLDGKPDLAVYRTNLAIVEALVTERDIPIEPVDEAALGGIDLDRDGRIGSASKVVYDWAPLEQRLMSYVGQARDAQRAGEVHLAAGLYPEGTEFLHTVRYVDVDENGDNRLAPRMKEVRYALKRLWVDYSKLEAKAAAEFKEKRDFPNRLKTVRGNLESGVSNGQGWAYTAFIEDASGELRPQTYEELVFCVGCHGGIGGNRDGVFSFERKLGSDAFQAGWYHWSQKGLRGTPERRLADGSFEYAHYLASNGAGDEFRANRELRDRFFDAQGKLKEAELAKVRDDIAELLFTSPARAMALNKAYREVVREQSYYLGREAMLAPLINVHEEIEPGTETGVREIQ
ncbi:hypothetical protein E4634_20245 [Mangrovimicrobium sediminis]|uniref:Lipoprotein n=2 Tax=Mangrovimicrobium sediminis TaxID=2562682 RepID=A0A4Z0LUS2_9GAMM|nr:hypothetical protein E4634_20245 [Haliea sp. SAOS-164]